eukprot:189651_1
MADLEEEKRQNESDVRNEEEQKHFLVIHIGDGVNFAPILGATKDDLPKMAEAGRTTDHRIHKEKVGQHIKHLLRQQSDPYIQIRIDDNPDTSFRTHVVFNCDGTPRWGRFARVYLDPKQLPKVINVLAFDKSDDPDIEDASYGSYSIECDQEQIFETKGKKWNRNVELGNGGCSVDIGICYDCCSPNSLKQRMTDKGFAREKLCSDTIDWISSNTPLYQNICESATQCEKLTSDMFSDIDYPPHKYRISGQFKQFASRYAAYDKDKTGIYYDKECDVLYALPNQNDDNMRLGGLNVTREVHLLWRYVFLKDEILAGQDAEFNIYKSYIFEPSAEKLVFCFIAMTVQLALTSAICYEIFQGVPFGFDDGVEGDELVIKILSGGVFVLLSIGTNRTTKMYLQFYEEIGCMFALPWFILFADFLSNIVIPIVITLVSYLFLATSESFTDLVLNSFALTFVAEIDDMVNTFDSDEEIVLQADLRAFYKTDCAVPRRIIYTWRHLAGVLWSPLGIFQSIRTAFLALKSVFISQKHKALWKSVHEKRQ